MIKEDLVSTCNEKTTLFLLIKKYISNLPNNVKSEQQYEEIKDPWKKLEGQKKPTIISKKELTVQELVSRLKKLPQDKKVVIDGYESGLDSIIDVCQTKVSFRKNSNWWDGIYEESNKDIDAIYLKSTRRMGK